MRVDLTIWKEGKEVFTFEAMVQHGLGLADIVELAFDEFTAQRPEISLLDPNVHFVIRGSNAPLKPKDERRPADVIGNDVNTPE